ncbi:hypothetical protein [Actinomadura sp. WMMB 499]|uniref:hypothetical protein n=1 Tax=Actinomadura sp. WMMB 499 TaxID=1219491 RepID=UPI0012491F36|nr:hypothetical protein [Actinomadura sp. WMMB 499]QFG23134.1 hypothetical protein F7P10_20410 [Actinomadura sp. WMMB 499]
MSPQVLGLQIGAGFGTAFVLANSGEPVPGAAGIALRVAAILCLIAVIVTGFRANRRAEPAPAERPGWFGPKFALIAITEFALIFGGIAVLRALDVPQECNVAWIALVVGLHFVALAPVWKRAAIAVPGVLLTALGATGMVMAALSHLDWIPFVSGTLSGVVLLGGCLYGAARR